MSAREAAGAFLGGLFCGAILLVVAPLGYSMLESWRAARPYRSNTKDGGGNGVSGGAS